MAQPGTTLILPVENQVREFDAKLLLACTAAERGFQVLLGSRTYTHFAADAIPRAVYLAKSMRGLSTTMFDILERLGHRIIAWDEEGLVRPPDRWYFERRLSEAAMRRVSALLAWGPSNAATLGAFPACRNIPIHVTGNPRIDMLRPEVLPYYQPEAERIRERYGPFLLVNSNFGHVNHYVQDLRVDAPRGRARDEYAAALAAHRSTVFEHFEQMLPALGRAFADHTIVIRPHPIESSERWQRLAATSPNLAVASDGNVAPWLMSCDALIQNGCQTAIEASLIGTPAVSYKPVTSELDVGLIDDLTHIANDLDSLIAALQAIVRGELGPRTGSERDAHLAQHLTALDGRPACDRMVDAIEASLRDAPLRPPRRTRVAGGRVRNRLRTALKRVRAGRSGGRASQDYHDHRFPQLETEVVRERIRRLGKQLGRFERIRLRPRSAYLFEISGPS